MSKLVSAALLFRGACAHPPPADSLRVHRMTRCADACSPAVAVQASFTVDSANEVWQCVCRPGETLAGPGI